MSDEIRMTNVMLEAIDGLKKRTFAFTCGDMMVSDGSFVEQIKPCLLYTSDAADERSSVDLGGRRIIKKKKTRDTEHLS